MVGQSISHYKLVEKLGEGGMGVVYKAEDTKLNRQVALKFLAQHLLDDAEAKERFLREAQAAAALHHPNVCPVYEIDEVDGKTFISMAFLKGETLEAQISEGPLPIKDALDITRQVADGLQAAHAEGVVHRDIKPANIIISPEGRPTIMDFGLARLTEASRLTKLDTAMGTVAYMSPEQAQGMEVDSRSDLWSLGCVLYEMVSGQRPFQGQYDQALLYEIVHEEVAPLTSVRAGVPMELEFIVGKCLAKDRDDRHQAAKEIAVDVRTLAEKLKSGRSTILRTTPMTGPVPATMTAAQTLNPAEALPPGAVVVQQKSQRLLQGLAAGFALAFLGLLAVHFTEAPPDAPLRRFALAGAETVGTGGSVGSGRYTSPVAISPDGRHIAYTSPNPAQGLAVQDLEQSGPRALEGSEGAVSPFWSPDSEFIGFATTEALFKVSVRGGVPSRLCELPNDHFHGGSWSPDGESIVFSSGQPHSLYEVSARGGSPELIASTEELEQPLTGAPALWPHFLPASAGDRVVVFSVGGYTEPTLVAQDLATGRRTVLGPGAFPHYAASGHILSQPAAEVYELWALPFSLDTLETVGESFPVSQGSGYPTASDEGTMVYLDNMGGNGIGRTLTLAWRDRTGELLETVGQPQNMAQPALSPDGQRVAVRSNESGYLDIWVHDLIRSTKTRLTFDEVTESQPAWSPSGREIAYRHRGGQTESLMRKAADGTGEAVVLVESESNLRWPDWSHDGRYLVYIEENSDTQRDIRYVELGSDGAASEPVTVLSTPASEDRPQLSPDGRFLAYMSTESGRNEIYVQPFPNGAGKWQVSGNGGDQIRWSSDGSELFYAEGLTLMSVSVSTEQGFTLGQPQMLFESDALTSNFSTTYDVSADGQRFVMTMTVGDGDDGEMAPPSIRIVQNWYEEFRDREQ